MQKFVPVLLLFALVSCSPKVSRVDPATQVDLSGRWNDTDSRMVADQMILDLVQSDNYRNYAKTLGRKPVIITGDFNAGGDNVAVHRLIGTPGAAQAGLPPFLDTFRVLHPGEKAAGTFNSWTGVTDGPKIDYVLVQPGVRVLSASILRDNRDGRYPSDHYPVVARVQLPNPR